MDIDLLLYTSAPSKLSANERHSLRVRDTV